MASVAGTYITNQGAALVTKLIAGKGTLRFTRAVAGTGKPPAGTDPKALKQLVSYKMDASMAGSGLEGSNAYANVQLNSNMVKQGFSCTEIGVYAQDPDVGAILFGYLSLADDPTYIYAGGTGGVSKIAQFMLYFAAGAVDKVTAVITPGAYVDVAEFDKETKAIRELIRQRGRVLVGPADTQLEAYETLFVTED